MNQKLTPQQQMAQAMQQAIGAKIADKLGKLTADLASAEAVIEMQQKQIEGLSKRVEELTPAEEPKEELFEDNDD